MTTVEQLVVQLVANITGYEREVGAAVRVTNAGISKIEDTFGRAEKASKDSSSVIVGSFKNIAAAATAALGVREVIQYADAWSRAKNSLISAKVPASQQAEVLQRLYMQAQTYGTALNAQVELYGSVSRAAKGLTDSQEDLFNFTEAVAASLKVDGKSAVEASGALLQLGQALRGPIIQAQEFNSLIDGAPALLEAAAAGIAKYGGNVAALITDAKDGKLATKDFFEGILKGADDLKARTDATATTFSSAFTKIENALTRFIGSTDEGLGASQRMIAGLEAFAENFDEIADSVVQLAAVISGALVGKAIAGLAVQIPIAIVAVRLLMIASRGAGAAAAFMAANFGSAAGAILAATTASRAFRMAAIFAFAGPIGLLIGGLAASLGLFAVGSGDASDATEGLNDEMRQLGLLSDDASKSVDDTRKSLDEMTDGQLARRLRQINEALEDLRRQSGSPASSLLDKLGIAETRGRLEEISDAVELLTSGLSGLFRSAEDMAALEEIARLSDGLRDGSTEAQTVIDRLDDLAETEVSSETDKLIEALDIAAQKVSGLIKLQREAGATPMTSPDALRSQEAEQIRLTLQQRRDFLSGRDAEMSKTDIERDIDERTQDIMKAAEEVGHAISEAAARVRATTEIQAEQLNDLISGNSSGAIDRYVGRVIGAESGGDRFAKNPDSSATGLGQFIESTWIDLFRRHFPDRAEGLTNAAILAFRTNADDSKRLIEEYAKENAAVLQKAGVAVTEANLHLSHFLGVGDAAKVLRAAPGTALQGLISGSSINANPTILGGGRTVDDAIAYANRRANTTRVAAGDLTASEEALEEQKEKRKELKATIDELFGSMSAETKQIVLETTLMSESTRMREKGLAAARLRNELTAAGIVITDDMAVAIEALSEAQGIAAANEESATQALALRAEEAEKALEALAEAEENAIEKMDSFRNSARDVLGGFVRDLREGKTVAEALGNALENIGDRLLDASLDSLISGIFGAPGTAAPQSGLFAALPKLLGFRSGGYTGGGGTGEVAGVVHSKEYVVNAKATARHRPLLEAINSGRGYEAGGFVAPPSISPSMLRLPAGGRAMSEPQNVHVTVGISKDGNLQAFVDRRAGQISSRTSAQAQQQSARQAPALLSDKQRRGI